MCYIVYSYPSSHDLRVTKTFLSYFFAQRTGEGRKQVQINTTSMNGLELQRVEQQMQLHLRSGATV